MANGKWQMAHSATNCAKMLKLACSHGRTKARARQFSNYFQCAQLEWRPPGKEGEVPHIFPTPNPKPTFHPRALEQLERKLSVVNAFLMPGKRCIKCGTQRCQNMLNVIKSKAEIEIQLRGNLASFPFVRWNFIKNGIQIQEKYYCLCLKTRFIVDSRSLCYSKLKKKPSRL